MFGAETPEEVRLRARPPPRGRSPTIKERPRDVQRAQPMALSLRRFDDPFCAVKMVNQVMKGGHKVMNAVDGYEQVSLDVDHVLSQLTTVEKISLLSGSDNWHTMPLPKHGIPAVRMSDGPNGVRGIYQFNGTPASCFPCATGVASSWDLALVAEIGRALAEECKVKGAHVLLAPTVNTQRSPVGGRGFESFSEDPHLNGMMAASYIKAVEQAGVIATIKHFVCNDQETDRKSYNAVVLPRVLREIYLKPFQIAIKASNPGALMTAYNRVNGVHVSESEELLQRVVRDEWKYDGLIMSDWSGTYSCSRAIKAGLDLEMPGTTTVRGAAVQRALVAGKLTMKDVEVCARRVLQLVKKAQLSSIPFDAAQDGVDTPELRDLLRKSAGSAVVLLKNDRNLLPLEPNNPNAPKAVKRIAVLGFNADVAITSGGGAADLLPSYTVTPLAGIRSAAREVWNLEDQDVPYAVGAPTFRYVPLLSRYLFTKSGEVGGLVQFWNGPFDATGLQQSAPVFETTTTSSLMLFNDHIPSAVNMTCWVRYTATFVPDSDGDWEFSLIVAGQGNLYIDGDLVIDNTTKQTLGTFFLGQGTVEERGVVKGMQRGCEYSFEVRATNEIQLNHNSVYKTRGAVRVGAWKPISATQAIQEAVELAAASDVAVVVVGLTQEFELEAVDRPDMKLPGDTDKLVKAVLEVNANTVVVTQSGMPVELPWLDQASTLVHAFYGGNELGTGLADVLFGKRCPSAKLPISWPRRSQDVPAQLSFGSGEQGNVSYMEGIYVGYRHPLAVTSFPFGHGLSYATFEYGPITCPTSITVSTLTSQADLAVGVNITNTGMMAAAEVVQIYVSDPASSVQRPEAELKGFGKVWLEPGESATVTIQLDRDAWAFWDEGMQSWVAEAGQFVIRAAASSTDVRSTAIVQLEDTVVWRGL